jgi:CrcB protein
MVSAAIVYRTLLVAVGGLFGSMARYWMSGGVQALHGSEFPYGTLAVNVLGSFILGLVMTLSLERGLISAETRILLGTGFCGGFTTMSTFSYETLIAAAVLAAVTAALRNIALSFGACLSAVWLGRRRRPCIVVSLHAPTCGARRSSYVLELPHEKSSGDGKLLRIVIGESDQCRGPAALRSNSA